MSGLQEILIVVLIVLGIILLPRITGRPAAPTLAGNAKRLRINSLMRMALAISGLWLIGAIIYHRAWEEITMPFYLFGMGPVLLGWTVYWVWSGINQKNKR